MHKHLFAFRNDRFSLHLNSTQKEKKLENGWPLFQHYFCILTSLKFVMKFINCFISAFLNAIQIKNLWHRKRFVTYILKNIIFSKSFFFSFHKSEFFCPFLFYFHAPVFRFNLSFLSFFLIYLFYLSF